MLTNIAGAWRRRPRRPSSLRASVASVIALLSLFPNLAVVMVVVLPVIRDRPELAQTLVPTALVWVLAVGGLSTLVGSSLSHALLRPLTRLKDDVSSISQGTRAAGLEVDGDAHQPTEVAAVRAAVSALLSSLWVEQTRRAAFMATLVHDLKTPIVAANHVLAVVRDDAQLPREDRVRLVASVLDENRRLLELVQRMVDAHRFERDEVMLETVPVDLGEVVRAIVDRLSGPAAARGVRLTVSGQGAASAAPAELERALSNLLENAVRYATSAVSVTVDGSNVTVSDDGPGLPAPLSELARPFGTQQVELGGRRYTSGTGGLGLFIATQVVTAHGGRLEALPSAKGACLRLNLRPA